jgi:hypothetical protein
MMDGRWPIVAAALACAVGAEGAQRTFVSGGGSDANVCSVASPCRSFATALSSTDPGGEVIVLDTAGYGTVTIAQSVSIVAPAGVYGGITAFAGDNGVVIDGAGITVTLRGLVITGLAGSSSGVNYLQGSALHIEGCAISGFGIRGVGILGPGELFIKDTEIRNGAQRGIRALGVHDPDVVRLTIDRSRVENNGAAGIEVADNARVLLNESVVSGNAGSGVTAGASVAGDVNEIVIERSAITHNNLGISAGSAVADGVHRTIVSNSIVASNLIGWNVQNDPNTTLYTRGNNVVRFNNTNQLGKAAVALGGD